MIIKFDDKGIKTLNKKETEISKELNYARDYARAYVEHRKLK